MIQTFLIGYFQILSVFGLVHPLHVSVADIVYDEKEKELEIVMRIFIDDLELSIRNQTKKQELNLLAPNGGETTDELVSAYLKEHLIISLDSKLQNTKYLGYEIEDLALVCYIQVSNVKKWSNIEVRNDIIMETHDDQSNLVHVTVKGKVLSMRLTKGKPVGKLTF
jgi:hypothetical protein